MRLTADLLHRAEQRTNCLGERELVLAGLGIPAIENLGAAGGDDYDSLDVSNNLLTRLENFPRWPRLARLMAAGNRIDGIGGGGGGGRNLATHVPNVRYAALAHNSLASLADVRALGAAWPQLEFLDLTGNPVTSEW